MSESQKEGAEEKDEEKDEVDERGENTDEEESSILPSSWRSHPVCVLEAYVCYYHMKLSWSEFWGYISIAYIHHD